MKDSDFTYAERNALGFVLALGVKPSHLQLKTSVTVSLASDMVFDDPDQALPGYVGYRLKPEYHGVAQRSRLYKAIRHLLDAGYRPTDRKNVKASHVSFEHPDDGRWAFASGNGGVYEATPERRFSTELVTKYRNG